jgi:hypothetical protein
MLFFDHKQGAAKTGAEDAASTSGGFKNMAFYKLDGAKFPSLEELKESMWVVYQDKMSEDEFEKYVQEKVEILE